jgi:hypothetical protein
MKNRFNIIFGLIITTAFFSSCDKTEQIIEDSKNDTLVGRWQVDSPSDDFLFIEFTDQSHFIIGIDTNADNIADSYIGDDFELNEENKINLENLASVLITTLEERTLEVEVTPIDDNKAVMSYVLIKVDPKYDNQKADDIVGSWKVEKLNGTNVDGNSLERICIYSNQGELYWQDWSSKNSQDDKAITFTKSSWDLDDLQNVVITGNKLTLNLQNGIFELIEYEGEINPIYNDFAGRWQVDSPSDDFLFIEFTDENHYIVGHDTNADGIADSYVGDDFELSEGNTIILENLASVLIATFDQKILRVKVTTLDQAQEDKSYSLTRLAAKFDNEKASDMIGSWRVAKLDGNDVTGTYWELVSIFSDQGEVFWQNHNDSNNQDDKTITFAANSWDLDDLQNAVIAGDKLTLNDPLGVIELVEYDGEITPIYVSF